MPVTFKPSSWRFKLRSLLLCLSLAVLIIPFGGIYIFRLYEGELVKQTEVELIAQAALIAAIYKREVQSLLASSGAIHEYGIPIESPAGKETYDPVGAQLNLSVYPIKPRPPEPAPTEIRADSIALQVGASLLPILLDAQRTTLAGVRLLDYQGIVTGGRADIGKSLAQIDEVRQARTGKYASALRERIIHRPTPALASISRGTGIRVFVAFPIVSQERLWGVVLLSRTPTSILQHLYSQRGTVLLVSAVILVLVVFLVGITSYSIARPLHALVAQTRQLAGGRKEPIQPLKSPVTEEVALLSESFIAMARSLDYRAQYIRNFAAHVSHEFKTPLSGIQGAVELLQEHIADMPEEKRARFLANIVHDAQRLKSLVDRLLEMARADVVEPVGGRTELAPTIAKLSERYKEQGLTVSSTVERNAVAAIAPEILETIFANLLDNSFQNGADRVEIEVGPSHGSLSIAVRDNGRGISPPNAEKIFTPFFTTRRNEGGTGLGLGIVRSLLKAYDGDISLEAGAAGATFRLFIPGAPK